MEVDQAAFGDGLTTVTARDLYPWIVNTLEPSTAFTTQVKKTVGQICEFLKRNCFEDDIHVLKTVKGGSAGKGTALKNKSDADVVLFVSCLSSYQVQKQNRKRILDLIKIRLKACRESLAFDVWIGEPNYKGPGSTPRSVSLTLLSKETGESIDMDILPAYDALGQVIEDARPNPEVYVNLLRACRDPGEFSPCFTELQKKFVKRYPARLKNLLRLVKYWYKERLNPQYPSAALPPKYALELLTIYAWEEGTGSADSFDMAQGFRTVLELLRQPQQIIIYWEKYYSLQHPEIGAHVKQLLRSPRPVILDPADPTGILGRSKDWGLMARAAATDCCSLLCLKNAQSWNVQVRLPEPVSITVPHPCPCCICPLALLSLQPARLVTIEVKQLSGTSLMKRVSPFTTIEQLKEMIRQDWGIPPCRQRLAHQEPGRSNISLQDSDTLATHGIFYNTMLLLLQTEEMKIFVKDDKNQNTAYMVLPTDTVRQLKEKIQAQQGPPAREQRLIYNSKELEDRHTLAHYDIRPMSIIYMLLRLRVGVGPQLS